ncbi:MAG: hypothetical protein A07HR60_01872, partial [uncultured archaeon A07HR60]
MMMPSPRDGSLAENRPTFDGDTPPVYQHGLAKEPIFRTRRWSSLSIE